MSHNELTRIVVDCSRLYKSSLLLLSFCSFLLQHTIPTFYQNLITKRVWVCPASLPKSHSHTIMEFCRAFSRPTKRNTTTRNDFSASARLSKSAVGLEVIGSPGWPQLPASKKKNEKLANGSSSSGYALRECLYKPSFADLLLLFQSTIHPSREQKRMSVILMCCTCGFCLSKSGIQSSMSFPPPSWISKTRSMSIMSLPRFP